jgi:hypothetical protein
MFFSAFVRGQVIPEVAGASESLATDVAGSLLLPLVLLLHMPSHS